MGLVVSNKLKVIIYIAIEVLTILFCIFPIVNDWLNWAIFLILVIGLIASSYLVRGATDEDEKLYKIVRIANIVAIVILTISVIISLFI